jgi:hypothetical protein
MERQIKIIVSDTAQVTGRAIDFFKQFDFKLTDNKNGILKFKQNSSLLDTWKPNPLKWGAEIFVSVADDKVLANFCVDTDAQMKTKEEEAVWQTFIDNFENYLTNGKTSNEKLSSIISDNKKSRLTYLSWAIMGALVGGLLAFLYNKLTGNNSTLSIFLIPVFATLFLGWRINSVKTKNAL